ncbi:MAG: hypothetical protein LBP37_02770 [Spirochaetaceae bacterium]|nr:hypothetical protein [Spirochaetaceae bacterium]
MINIYGKKVENDYYSTTLHHMISDFSALIYKNKNLVVLAGDFNATEQYENIHGNEYPSDKIIFNRLEDLGLVNCTKRQFGSHIETHIQNNIPWQDDYIFINEKYYSKENCVIKIPDKNEIYKLSDHILLELNIKI